VRADCDVPFGSRVLVRGDRASLADPELANAIAVRTDCWWERYDIVAAGTTFSVEMIEGLGERSLQAIADGPIMDPSLLYLPAGKLSIAETRARESTQLIDARGVGE
jgi:hypothetical protein